jgi:hypothetical protein
MKGILHKTNRGWVVKQVVKEGPDAKLINQYPLIDNGHIDGLKLYDSNEGLEVDFEIVTDYDNNGPDHFPKYAKIITPEEAELKDKQTYIMKTQKEIEKLAKSIYGKGVKDYNKEGFIKGYTQCQEDMQHVYTIVHTYQEELKDWDVTLNDGLENEPYVSDDFQIGPDGAYEHTQGLSILPREKASELVDKFSNKCLLTTDGGKVAALIAVDEIKRILYDQDSMIRYDYWFEVKKEIEKL